MADFAESAAVAATAEEPKLCPRCGKPMTDVFERVAKVEVGDDAEMIIHLKCAFVEEPVRVFSAITGAWEKYW